MARLTLRRLLAHPLVRDIPLDDPRIHERRRRLIRDKPFLKALYDEWHDLLLSELPRRGWVLEIGAGGGHLSAREPRIIRSELVPIPGADLAADARRLPFGEGALDGIVMTDVLHHLPQVRRFLAEAVRCLRPGGRVVMIEPWRTPWSELVYRRLHHEPFDPGAAWDLPPAGPLTGANAALPWIIFHRDRPLFEATFPSLAIVRVAPLMPFAYLLSGGVSLRCPLPGRSYPLVRRLERSLRAERWGMFALIVLESRREVTGARAQGRG